MRFVILTKLLLFFSLPTFAESQDFTVYHVKHRAPEELVRVASGVMSGRAAFSVMDSRVIISGDSTSTKAALKLFEELDRKPRMYRVSISRGGREQARDDGVGVGLDLQKNKIGARMASKEAKGGVTVQAGGASVSARSSRMESASSDNDSVQVMEGGDAQLSTGNFLFPSGMWVKPRALGKGKVQLEIYSRRQKNGLEAESASTSVQVPLGEWVSIGGVNRQAEGSRDEIGGAGRSSGRSGSEISVKVEEVP